MKLRNLIFLLLFASGFVSGQKVSIKGQVKNASGNPVPLAFIKDSQNSIATFADSSGAFLIKVAPTAALTIIADGYNDAQAKVDGKSEMVVSLTQGVSSSVSNSSLPSVADNNSDAGLTFLTRQDISNTQSGGSSSQVVKAGFTQEATRGNPYLFAGWAHGYALGTDGKLLYNIDALYNYDKITGQLVFTMDKNSLMRVNKEDVKQFYLFDGKLFPHVFEKASVLPNQAFVELMVSTSKYKLYKQTTTKLVRANYHTDGIIESGHRYDEYTDDARYYFFKIGDAKAKSISLKRKAIKEAFGGDADKFVDAQGSRDIDDDYLRELNSILQ